MNKEKKKKEKKKERKMTEPQQPAPIQNQPTATQPKPGKKKKKNCTHLRSFIHDLFMQCVTSSTNSHENKKRPSVQRASIEVLQNATHNLIQQLSTELLQLKSSAMKRNKNAIVKPFDIYSALNLIFAQTPELAKDVRQAYEAAESKLKENEGEKKKDDKNKTVTSRCGLVLPVPRIKKRFRKCGVHYSFSRTALVVLTAALETVVKHWIKCALSCMKEGSQLLKKKHLDEARHRDEQLGSLFDRRHILISGTTGIFASSSEKPTMKLKGKRKREEVEETGGREEEKNKSQKIIES